MDGTIFRQDVVDLAERYKGCKTGDEKHKLIIDTYNSWFTGRYPRGHKATYTDYWCQEFVDAISIMQQAISIVPNECGCGEAVAIAKQMGTWKGRTYIPQPADIIYFDWDKNGWADHTGFVKAVENENVYTIEGNAQNGECCENVYSIYDDRILGYCTPNYDSLFEEPQPEQPEYAENYDERLAGKYRVTTWLYLRPRPGEKLSYVTVLKGGSEVTANGWYTDKGSTRWVYVEQGNYKGYAASKYLQKVG